MGPWGAGPHLLPGRNPALLCRSTTLRPALAISLNIFACTYCIFKSLLDMGLGCCQSTLSHNRELMLTGMTRLKSIWSYFSPSLRLERVKKLPETLLLLRQENKSKTSSCSPSFFVHYELCFSLALQK